MPSHNNIVPYREPLDGVPLGDLGHAAGALPLAEQLVPVELLHAAAKESFEETLFRRLRHLHFLLNIAFLYHEFIDNNTISN